MEFKVKYTAIVDGVDKFVLIESDWNLKVSSTFVPLLVHFVLIESDWNLKDQAKQLCRVIQRVLIESDWNLKEALYKTTAELRKY